MRVEREPADRVHQREPVRAGVDDRARRLGDVPLRRRELRVERLRRSPRAQRRRARPRSRAPPRRSGRTGSARSWRPRRRRRAARSTARSRRAEKPPTETQSGTSELGETRQVSSTKASMPGPCRPIEFSIPWSVSAIRGGGFPSRGSGVIVFVTKASSARRDLGGGQRVEAARGVEDRDARRVTARDRSALRTRSTGPSTHSRRYARLELDHAAVARAVAAGHRRLPRQLRARRRGATIASSIGSGPQARTSPGSVGQRVRDERRLEHDRRRSARARPPQRARRAETEQRRRRAELLREVRQRRDSDPAADEQRPFDGEVESVAERAQDMDRVARPEPGDAPACPGPIGSKRKPSSPAGA